MFKNLKIILKNFNILAAIAIFQFIVILDMFTIIYTVVVDHDVVFTNNYEFIQGISAVIAMGLIIIILNFLTIFLSFSKLQSSTVLFPFTIIATIFFYFTFANLSFIDSPNMLALIFGIIVGIFYEIVFYTPAIWFYFRFRMVNLALAWLSIIYFTTLLLLGNFTGGSDTFQESLILIRPDFLFISALFYLCLALLLLLDNTTSLARWNRTPANTFKIPWKTIIPIGFILLIVTIISNLISPFFWRSIWKLQDDQNPQKTSEADLDPSANIGTSSNLQQNSDGSISINPNQGLLGNTSGENSENPILILIKVDFSENSNPGTTLESLEPYYWKLWNNDTFSFEKGFYNTFAYDTDETSQNLKFNGDYSYLDFATSSIYSENISQTLIFKSLKTNFVIGSEKQQAIRLLQGSERVLYQLKNKNFVTEKNHPFITNDSYQLKSSISTLDPIKDRSSILQFQQNYYQSEYEQKLYSDITSANLDFPLDTEIYQLAADITHGKSSRLDKTLAIENYLRTNYTYTLNPGDPENLDPAQAGIQRLKYFLFEKKSGYCTYYASAMVALLRSQGIPSRVAEGFAVGEYSSELDVYIINQNYAHAWVEVYFEKLGWIKFEPTSPQNTTKQIQISAKEKEQLKQDLKKTLKQQENFQGKTNNEQKNDPSQSPEWLQDFTKKNQKYLQGLIMLLKYLLISIFCLSSLLFIFTPPAWNIFQENYLKGNIFKPEPGKQIINLYKLWLRKLGKKKSILIRKSSETALEHWQRIQVLPELNNIINKKDTEVILTIYQYAFFGEKISDNDLIKMKTSTQKAFKLLESKISLGEMLRMYWWK
ncbi:MAG: transglutaminase-like domain-containing protein [bacterium]